MWRDTGSAQGTEYTGGAGQYKTTSSRKVKHAAENFLIVKLSKWRLVAKRMVKL